jgi:phosphoribosylformimino-5-aminoimidazole carboxamide ribotide isomerase
MLIPSIDLMGGQVVQLQQGDRLAIASADLDGWIARFSGFPLVQLIDLDAALRKGDNRHLIEKVCRALPCQVGGGIRTADRARDLLAIGAHRVIVGSSLFEGGRVNVEGASALAEAVGVGRIVAAVDSRGGRVVIHGWKTPLDITPIDAMQALEPYCDAFLYTHVDTEGMLTGIDLDLFKSIAAASRRRLIAAGGIRSMDEVNALDAAGIDAVVGMAIYKGLIDIRPKAQGPGPQ